LPDLQRDAYSIHSYAAHLTVCNTGPGARRLSMPSLLRIRANCETPFRAALQRHTHLCTRQLSRCLDTGADSRFVLVHHRLKPRLPLTPSTPISPLLPIMAVPPQRWAWRTRNGTYPQYALLPWLAVTTASAAHLWTTISRMRVTNRLVAAYRMRYFRMVDVLPFGSRCVAPLLERPSLRTIKNERSGRRNTGAAWGIRHVGVTSGWPPLLTFSFLTLGAFRHGVMAFLGRLLVTL